MRAKDHIGLVGPRGSKEYIVESVAVHVACTRNFETCPGDGEAVGSRERRQARPWRKSLIIPEHDLILAISRRRNDNVVNAVPVYVACRGDPEARRI